MRDPDKVKAERRRGKCVSVVPATVRLCLPLRCRFFQACPPVSVSGQILKSVELSLSVRAPGSDSP